MVSLFLALALATTTNDPAEGFNWDNECGIDCVEPQDLWDAALAYRFKWQDCELVLNEKRIDLRAAMDKLAVRTSTAIEAVAFQAADRAVEKRESEGWSKATWFWLGTTTGVIVTGAVTFLIWRLTDRSNL